MPNDILNDFVPVWWVHFWTDGDYMVFPSTQKQPRYETFTPKFKMTKYGFSGYVACDSQADAIRIVKEAYDEQLKGANSNA